MHARGGLHRGRNLEGLFRVAERVTSPGMSEPARRGGPGDVRLAETLLVVDDEAAVRALARDMLVSLGHVVLATGDPQHALRLSQEQPIHLLVVDVIMPLMKGTEL